MPVVSTTLASFDRLFSGLTEESTGWLLIDEAGQATPQSIATALWRSKKAVIIGDPMQIEPVLSIPDQLISEIRIQYQVDKQWSPATESAQTIADRSMSLGTYIGNDAWTGMPLRCHRRCIDPMFKVANAIAYNNQMVQTISYNNSSLPKSRWINVQGLTVNMQLVNEEILVLANLLNHLKYRCKVNWHSEINDIPVSLYVISPFKIVAEACKKIIKDMKLQPHVTGGTIHTFQGKEADAVIIVLGSAPGTAGQGSRNWASQKPNILNVALTRAKSRVYVIGNVTDWTAHHYFDVLYKELST